MKPRRALLLVDHGSRQAAANELLEQIGGLVRARRPDLVVELAHMEIATPSLEEGVAACISAGAREIVIHPYFLAPGLHTQHTIPELVAKSAARHPDVALRISQPLGLHEKLLDVVIERFDETAFD